ncbi:MAG: hypothetical protein J6D44_04575 [Pseudomonas sp.]|nr:hypothetical protein [Pseudomonas sp.]
MTDYYVYSTLSNDNNYGGVFIAGKANVANKNIVTPLGMATKVDDSALSVLESSHVFRLHKENGFITVEKYKEDADLVASDMTGRDASAPETPETLMLKDGTVESVEGTDIKHKKTK